MSSKTLDNVLDFFRNKHSGLCTALRAVYANENVRRAMLSLGISTGSTYSSSVDSVRRRYVLLSANVPLFFIGVIENHFGADTRYSALDLPSSNVVFDQHEISADEIKIDYVVAVYDNAKEGPDIDKDTLTWLRPADAGQCFGFWRRPCVMFGSVSVVRNGETFAIDEYHLLVPGTIIKASDEIACAPGLVHDFLDQSCEAIASEPKNTAQNHMWSLHFIGACAAALVAAAACFLQYNE